MNRSTARSVLITGSSSGIGRATALLLSSGGWTVWGGSRRAAPDPSAPAAWQSLQLDVTSDASVETAVGTVVQASGRIDALVHCAGIAVAGAVEDVTIPEAEQQLATNYLGTVRMLRAVLPIMRRQDEGRIVVIGSVGGLIGLPFLGHYSASKFALDGLVEALRHELAPFAIQATIVHPGDIRTDISANQIEGQATGPGSAYHARFRATIDAYDRNVREARSPEVIADVVARVLARRRQPASVVAGTAIERAGVGLKGALPRRWFERVLRKSYGL